MCAMHVAIAVGVYKALLISTLCSYVAMGMLHCAVCVNYKYYSMTIYTEA